MRLINSNITEDLNRVSVLNFTENYLIKGYQVDNNNQKDNVEISVSTAGYFIDEVVRRYDNTIHDFKESLYR